MPVLLPLLLAGLPQATAPKPKHKTATQSARAFSLDMPAADTATPAPDAAAPAPPAAFSLDTPIRALIADPGAKAVLDKDLPGLSDDSNLSKFEDMSLRRFQPMTGGQLSDKLLAKTGEDLAALGGSPTVTDTASPVAAPVKGRSRAGEGR